LPEAGRVTRLRIWDFGEIFQGHLDFKAEAGNSVFFCLRNMGNFLPLPSTSLVKGKRKALEKT
jgi:hypothetical protein